MLMQPTNLSSGSLESGGWCALFRLPLRISSMALIMVMPLCNKTVSLKTPRAASHRKFTSNTAKGIYWLPYQEVHVEQGFRTDEPESSSYFFCLPLSSGRQIPPKSDSPPCPLPLTLRSCKSANNNNTTCLLILFKKEKACVTQHSKEQCKDLT